MKAILTRVLIFIFLGFPALLMAAGNSHFPDVIAVTVTGEHDTFRFDVTLSSPYDSVARYADAWRVMSADGVVYGLRELLHDHAGEQPFTRSLSGVVIPLGETSVIIQGRDQTYGWGGKMLTVTLPVTLAKPTHSEQP